MHPLILSLLLSTGCEAKRNKANKPSSDTCPVVELPAPIEPPEDEIEWWIPVGDQLIGHRSSSLAIWEIRDGASPSFEWSETYPHWMWAPRDGALVNYRTGARINPDRPQFIENALPESERLDNLDEVGRGPGFLAWAAYEEAVVHLYRNGVIETVAWTGPAGAIDDVALDPDGDVWLGGSEWVAEMGPGGEQKRSFHAAPIALRALAVHPDGTALAVMAYEGVVNLYDLQTRTVRWSWPAGLGAMTFSPKGTWLSVSSPFEGTDIVDAATGCLVQRLAVPGVVHWLDDQRLAWADDDGVLHIQEVAP